MTDHTKDAYPEVGVHRVRVRIKYGHYRGWCKCGWAHCHKDPGNVESAALVHLQLALVSKEHGFEYAGIQ